MKFDFRCDFKNGDIINYSAFLFVEAKNQFQKPVENQLAIYNKIKYTVC
jgi:hypothetical protein